MASEIRVNKIENRSGLGTVTFADTGVDLAGIVTATTFSGSGASLTNVPDSALSAVTASKLSGALPAISAASLTNVPAANVVGVHTSLTVTNATTTGTVVVGGGVTISESGIEASGIGITVANINGTQIGGRRNLVINGAMTVAQRGTPTASGSYTTAAYGACDRWKLEANSTDQADFVISQESDAPTGSGFNKSIKIKTNTAETSLDSNEILHVSQPIEAQDLQHLKNGTSSALPITLSFWVKSYQTGTYVVTVYKPDNTQRQISATYTISASNTWEFKTMTFPGDTSGSGIANDTGTGFQIYWLLAAGTDFTGTTNTSWANYANGGFANGQSVNIMSSTDNYFYLTGAQLEIGTQATAFEHRSFGEELSLCQRYFFRHSGDSGTYSNAIGFSNGSSSASFVYNFPNTMRALPSLTLVGTFRAQGGPTDSASFTSGLAVNTGSNTNYCRLQLTGSSGMTAGDGYILQFYGGNANLNWDAEL